MYARSDASPDVEGIETPRVVPKCHLRSQMHRPMLRALKLGFELGKHICDLSDASPDVEGIETKANLALIA